MKKLILKVYVENGTQICGAKDFVELITAEEQAAENNADVESYSDIVITVEESAEQSGVTDPNDYHLVEDDAYTADEFYFFRGFEVVNGVSSWSVDRAKAQIREDISRVFTNIIKKTVVDSEFSQEIIIAQSSLSTGRLPAVQALIDVINAKTTEMNTSFTSAETATTAAELRSIANGLPDDPYPDEPDLIE